MGTKVCDPENGEPMNFAATTRDKCKLSAQLEVGQNVRVTDEEGNVYEGEVVFTTKKYNRIHKTIETNDEMVNLIVVTDIEGGLVDVGLEERGNFLMKDVLCVEAK